MCFGTHRIDKFGTNWEQFVRSLISSNTHRSYEITNETTSGVTRDERALHGTVPDEPTRTDHINRDEERRPHHNPATASSRHERNLNQTN